MERKEGISSGAVPKGSNIPAFNSKGTQVKTKSESFQRGLNRQSSNSKVVKTAIVKPYNFAADSKVSNNPPGPSIQEAGTNSGGEESTVSRGKAKSPAQGERNALQHSGSETKIVPPAVRYKAHSGISFVASPRKQADPNPFARGQRKLLQSTRGRAPVFQKDGGCSSVDADRTDRRRVSPKEGASNRVPQKSLADASKTVLQDAPVLVEKFSGHSGILFEPRKSARPRNNPFARSNTIPPQPPGKAAKK